jgi:hypothetical protein
MIKLSKSSNMKSEGGRSSVATRRILLLATCLAPLLIIKEKSAMASSDSAITFSRAPDAAVQSLQRRDEAMTWQCIGRSMFDCDGEREKKAEEASEEFRKMFKQP